MTAFLSLSLSLSVCVCVCVYIYIYIDIYIYTQTSISTCVTRTPKYRDGPDRPGGHWQEDEWGDSFLHTPILVGHMCSIAHAVTRKRNHTGGWHAQQDQYWRKRDLGSLNGSVQGRRCCPWYTHTHRDRKRSSERERESWAQGRRCSV